MKKNLVAYFSCTGTTRKVAENLAKVTDGDLFEIVPSEPYTSNDLNWHDKNSRTSIEMNDENSRPTISRKLDNIDDYDTIFLGFPIWWYTAPRIINTFIESYDLSGKTIVIFYTSGGSGLGNTISDLKRTCKDNINFVPGNRFTRSTSENDLKSWVDSLNL